MPSIPDRTQQQKPVQAKVEIPADFPDIPQEILARFPSAAAWQRDIENFWERTGQAIQAAQVQIAGQVNSLSILSPETFNIFNKITKAAEPMVVVDGTGIRLGHVLVVDVKGRTLHVGVGNYFNDDTPIYMDIDGKFSLGASFAYDPTVGPGIAVAITGGTIDNTPIGVTVPAAGNFTTIGDTTRGTGKFTTLDANGLFTVNPNGGAIVAGIATPIAYFVGTDGTNARVYIDAYAGIPILQFRRADTSLAAKSAVQNGENLGAIAWQAFGATVYAVGSGATLAALATENWSDTAHGTLLQFRTTPNGSVTNVIALTLEQDQSATFASTIKTAAPTGGAGLWKLGKYTAGVLVQAGSVIVNVDGVDRTFLTA